MNTPPAPHPLERLTLVLKALLIMGAVVAAAAALSSALQAELLGRESFTRAEAELNDARQSVVSWFQLGLFLLTACVFGRWIYRANRDVRTLGAEGLSCGPGWAVGWFFVPLFNLWKPYAAMKELWSASHRPADWRRHPIASLLPLWWSLFLFTNFSSRLGSKMLARTEDVAVMQSASWILCASDVLNFGLHLAAIVLVSRIAQAQAAHWDARAGVA